ncbi:MAG TPA: hypothetical protein VEY12_01135 [Thermoplasmata archaeon]|nr:hypothetical protein [Thermoplasmata archaeon]
MPLTRKAITILLATALLGTMFLAASGDARATQNAPSWTTGNQWVYSATSGGSTASLTMVVKEQTTVTLGSTTYTVWHVAATSTTSSGSSSFSFTYDQYYTVDGLRFAKQNGTFPFLGTITSSYAAPYPLAVFPLNPGASWIGNSTETTLSAFGTSTSNYHWNGSVLSEQAVTVPAGTYTASVVWSKAVGSTAPAVYYYSEQAGWAVRIDSYNNGGHYTGSMNLTSTNYSPGFLGISNVVWIVGLVIAFIVIVAAVVFLRRRPRMPYGAPPPGYAQPPYPQPPQQGPPGPPR